MQVYLFRDQSGSKSMAYSTDVTGRNIPRLEARTEWRFVRTVSEQDKSHDCEEVIRHLRQVGFFVFE